jgi:CO/xanthine dehydrogenase Mo-binding subunit
MVVAERLGLPLEKVTVHKGDTDEIASGGGTYGSKSLQLGGTAAAGAAETVVDQAKKLVADYLEANVDDVVLDLGLGRFHVAGTADPSLSWAELAEHAAGDDRLDELKASHEWAASQRSRSGRTSRSSRSTPRPVRSSCSAWCASTTPARSSTRCSRRGRCTAGSRWASRRRSTSSSSTARTAHP